jgi:hypothetical protein
MKEGFCNDHLKDTNQTTKHFSIINMNKCLNIPLNRSDTRNIRGSRTTVWDSQHTVLTSVMELIMSMACHFLDVWSLVIFPVTVVMSIKIHVFCPARKQLCFLTLHLYLRT